MVSLFKIPRFQSEGVLKLTREEEKLPRSPSMT